MSSCSLSTRSVWGRRDCRGSVVLCVRVVRVINLVRVVRVVLLVLGWEVLKLLCPAGGVGGAERHPAGAIIRLEATAAAPAGYTPESG